MKVLIIRHAIAEERDDFARTGKDDRLRPLTDEGRKKMKQAARGLKALVPEIDLLATSPLTRAAQTAAVLDSVYGGLSEVEIEELAH
jgi:phosphohistidine phosphatase